MPWLWTRRKKKERKKNLCFNKCWERKRNTFLRNAPGAQTAAHTQTHKYKKVSESLNCVHQYAYNHIARVCEVVFVNLVSNRNWMRNKQTNKYTRQHTANIIPFYMMKNITKRDEVIEIRECERALEPLTLTMSPTEEHPNSMESKLWICIFEHSTQPHTVHFNFDRIFLFVLLLKIVCFFSMAFVSLCLYWPNNYKCT